MGNDDLHAGLGAAQGVFQLGTRAVGSCPGRADAVGLLFLDKRTGGLTPLVYVPAAGTLCWEKSCASGTTAVGYYLAREQGEPVTATLRQPGGVLKIAADPDGRLMLTGAVRKLDTKTIDI